MKVEYKAALKSNDTFRDKPVEWSGNFTGEAEMITGNMWKGMLIDKGDGKPIQFKRADDVCFMWT